MGNNNLYDEVVAVTYDYLGPAADRFVVRQIRNHLRKEPDQLEPKDLQILMDWIRLAMQLISGDSKVIGSYMADLRTLVQKHEKSGPHNGKKVR